MHDAGWAGQAIKQTVNRINRVELRGKAKEEAKKRRASIALRVKRKAQHIAREGEGKVTLNRKDWPPKLDAPTLPPIAAHVPLMLFVRFGKRAKWLERENMNNLLCGGCDGRRMEAV